MIQVNNSVHKSILGYPLDLHTLIGGLRIRAISIVMISRNMKYLMNQESHCSQLLIPIILIASCNAVTIVTRPNL